MLKNTEKKYLEKENEMENEESDVMKEAMELMRKLNEKFMLTTSKGNPSRKRVRELYKFYQRMAVFGYEEGKKRLRKETIEKNLRDLAEIGITEDDLWELIPRRILYNPNPSPYVFVFTFNGKKISEK